MSDEVKVAICPPPPPPPQALQGNISKETDVKERHDQVLQFRRQTLADELGRLLFSRFRKISGVLQEGPTCGLVALFMAGQFLNPENRTPVEVIVNQARFHKMTVKGEMFSVYNMAKLAEIVFGCRTEIVLTEKQKFKIFQHLNTGCPVLAPYDASQNHEPTCRNGHKAHWALLCGFCAAVGEGYEKWTQLSMVTRDSCLDNLYHITSDLPLEALKSVISDASEHLYVYGYQGKSLYPGIWKYRSLCRSNENLNEISPSLLLEDMVVPEGGIKEGLASKVVLLYTS